MIPDLTASNPYIQKTFGSNSAIIGNNQVLAFELGADMPKIITHISCSFSKPDNFWKGAIVIIRETVSRARLPININNVALQADRLEYLRFFSTPDGVSEQVAISAESNEFLSVILFPAFVTTDVVNPATLFGTLNVFGRFGNNKPLFTVAN